MFLNDSSLFNETFGNATNNTYHFQSAAYDRASVILWSVISPILLLIGLVGNTTAFLVLSKLFRQQRTAFHLFLAVLSLNDMVVLLSGLLYYWLLNLFGVNLRDLSNASCKLELFVIYTTMQYSAWILVSVTLQRCLIVARPTKYKELYTAKVAVIQLVTIFVVLSAVNFHFFFSNGIVDGECNSLTEAIFEFEEFVFVWIDLFLLCIIPFVIMLLANVYFMINVKQYGAAVNSSGNVIDKKIQHSIRIIMRLTWLFLATTLPICLVLILDSYYKDEDAINILKTISYITQYAGFSFNIVLYVSVDRKFVTVLRTKAKKVRQSLRSTGSIPLRRIVSYTKSTSNSASEAHTLHTEKVNI